MTSSWQQTEESLDSGRRLTNRLHTYQGYVFEVGRSTVIGEDKSSEDVELLGLNGQDGRPWRGASAGREGLARDGDFVRVPGSEAGILARRRFPRRDRSFLGLPSLHREEFKAASRPAVTFWLSRVV